MATSMAVIFGEERPQRYVKRETPVSERLMYRQVMTCGHQFLLGSREGLELAAAALRKVMTAYAD